jgi:hypothetical protein
MLPKQRAKTRKHILLILKVKAFAGIVLTDMGKKCIV